MTIDADVAPYNGSKPRCLAQALYAISKDGTEPGYVKRIIVSSMRNLKLMDC